MLGNEIVEKTWMGNYDPRSGKKIYGKDQRKSDKEKNPAIFKTFLEDKYEKKCWYADYKPEPPKRIGQLFQNFLKNQFKLWFLFVRTVFYVSEIGTKVA
jgi:hypothetical protein